MKDYHLSAGLENSINLYSELMLLEYGKNDLWYLAQMLKERAFYNKQDYLLKRVDLDNYIKENNKISAGLLHLFKRTATLKEEGLIQHLPSKFTLRQLTKVQDNILKIFLQEDPEELIPILKESVDAELIHWIQKESDEIMKPFRMGIIDTEEHISRFLKFSGELLALSGMRNKVNNPTPEKPVVLAASQPPMLTRKEAVNHAKNLLAQNEISEAIEIIESLCKTKNQLLLLDRIKLQQQLNEEDLFFTRKDENMLVKRSQDVVTALLDILGGFE